MATNLDKTLEFRMNPKMLALFSANRVDMYTTQVMFTSCLDFKLSVNGQRKMNNALNNLPVFFTPDQSLSFGWGLKHVIRGQELNEGRYEHVALGAAMMEFVPAAYVAKVFYEIAHFSEKKFDIMPRLAPWLGVVESVNGLFATTGFGLLVEEYMRLDPDGNLTENHLKAPPQLPQPIFFAQALMALAAASNGGITHIKITGGSVLGWFAAVAEWLFDLHILVLSKDGKKLKAPPEGADAQLTLIFDHSSDDVMGVECQPERKDDKHPRLQAASPAPIHLPFGGRLAWQSLLPKVFGQTFYILDHTEAKPFGTAIGSAARVFEGIATGQLDIFNGAFSVAGDTKCNPASYGIGLVTTITNWLPELRRGQGRMERALKLSYDDALLSIQDCVKKLSDICHCKICSRNQTDMERLKISDSSDEGHCLEVLLETIVALGLMLSKTIVTSELYPKRMGIQSFYNSQVARRTEANNPNIKGVDRFNLVYGNLWNASNIKRLKNCVEIFAGSQPSTDTPSNLVAVSHEGICAYLLKVEKHDGRTSAADTNVIRVVSGAISLDQRVYKSLCLGSSPETDDILEGWEEIRVEHLTESLYGK